MLRYVGKRLVLAVVVVVGVVVLTFVIARVIPGDPAAAYAGAHATETQIAVVRKQLGLNRPFGTQLFDYVRGIFTGDWGTSLRTHNRVIDDIGSALPPSIQLVVVALVIAVVIGMPLGVLSARWQGRFPDSFVRVGAVLATSLPVFLFALILQRVFFQELGWLPVAGQYDPDLYYVHPLATHTHMPVVDALVTGNWTVLRSAISHMILPAFAIALYPTGLIARMVRASLLEVLGEEHIRMTRALGFSERSVFVHFALKPAVNPIVQVFALVFAFSLANSFLVEAVFDWPGLGNYAANSLLALDTPAVLGVTLVIAMVYVVLNLVVDLIQAALDPRIRLT